MIDEVEVKLRIPGTEAAVVLSEKCQSLSGGGGETSFQRDEYFDTPDLRLSKLDYTVRLRICNGIAHIALKSPRIFEGAAYARIELEFTVGDENEVRYEIAHRGLVVTAIIEKRRIAFKIGSVNVAIDEVPMIGFFCEVEGQNVEMVHQLVAELGIEGYPKLTKNYTELVRDALGESIKESGPIIKATFRSNGK